MLYCIQCEKVVKEDSTLMVDLFHLNTVQVNDSLDPGSRFDLEVCEFPLGYAFCPPPPFNLDEYIQREGQPPAVIAEDFLPYSYDVESDQIVEEVLL